MSEAPAEKSLVEIGMSVRWGDMDAFNHVNNTVYATYVEEARLHWFRSIEGGYMDEQSAPILAAQHLNYRVPIEWPEEVSVSLRTSRVGNSSVTLSFKIVSRAHPERVYCDGDTVLVWVDRASGKPIALPEKVRRAT
jgi:acyl-CoA thioester hydrolase